MVGVGQPSPRQKVGAVGPALWVGWGWVGGRESLLRAIFTPHGHNIRSRKKAVWPRKPFLHMRQRVDAAEGSGG